MVVVKEDEEEEHYYRHCQLDLAPLMVPYSQQEIISALSWTWTTKDVVNAR